MNYTKSLPTVAHDATGYEEALCEWCGNYIYRSTATGIWYHTETKSEYCGPVAESIEGLIARPGEVSQCENCLRTLICEPDLEVWVHEFSSMYPCGSKDFILSSELLP